MKKKKMIVCENLELKELTLLPQLLVVAVVVVAVLGNPVEEEEAISEISIFLHETHLLLEHSILKTVFLVSNIPGCLCP